MKLKTSNNKTHIFLGVLAVLTFLLLSWTKVNDKASKYAKAPEFEQKTTLNLVQVTLNEKHYNKLKKKRDKAISAKILETSDNDYVPATISFNGKDYKADIRLKGDWTDHLVGEKWSFRVKLKDDKTILGMRKFSIHHPKTRGYINEWLYHKVIKEENLIGLRYDFLEGAIHIKKENSFSYITKEVGIYAIEETFDKRTIENNQRKESIILKFNENYWWSEVKKSIAVGEPSGLYWRDFMTSSTFPITMFSEGKMLQDSTMHNYFNLSKNLLHKLRADKITIADAFDVKKLATQNAILNLFGGTHGNYIINVRFYYNPITSKLEPIAFDGNSGIKLDKYVNFIFENEERDSIYQKELIHALNRVSQPDYLNAYLDNNKREITGFEKSLKKEFRTTGLSRENLQHNQSILRKELMRLQEKFNIETDNFEVASELKVKEKVNSPEFKLWSNNNTSITKTNSLYKQRPIYKMSRLSSSEASYTAINNIKSNNGSNYKVSMIVKKGEGSNNFGLRVSGVYPNRVDAVFDLNQGKLKGATEEGDFKNSQASITELENGWYRCTLSGKVNSQNIKILFGPTNDKVRTRSWESKINGNSVVYILPNSLTIEELTD